MKPHCIVPKNCGEKEGKKNLNNVVILLSVEAAARMWAHQLFETSGVCTSMAQEHPGCASCGPPRSRVDSIEVDGNVMDNVCVIGM